MDKIDGSLSIILNIFKKFTKFFQILKIYNIFSNLINSYFVNSLKPELQNHNYKSILKKIKVITFL